MAKKSTIFICQNCGNSYSKWQGKCDVCGEWNCIVEENVQTDGYSKINSKKEGHIIDFVPLKGTTQTYSRLQTGIAEIDRVTGGGLVPGSVILVGGDPGIGKSTLLLQVCAGLAQSA
jgi:DNA repair protein RadA/Sms